MPPAYSCKSGFSIPWFPFASLASSAVKQNCFFNRKGLSAAQPQPNVPECARLGRSNAQMVMSVAI